ncbi:MAG: hypothetical protein HC915_17590 [Anaerolineae bacterium]|nr:hypothetical protein [Anaerolineae bacterium]
MMEATWASATNLFQLSEEHAMLQAATRDFARREILPIAAEHDRSGEFPVRTIQQIRDAGCRPGIAIDPGMSLETVKHLLPLVEVACVMTVNPGYAGQKLIPFCIDKMAELSQWKRSTIPICSLK